MKTKFLATLLALLAISFSHAFDPEKASTERFIVSYLETETLPPLSIIPNLQVRERALEYEQEFIEGGAPEEAMDRIRRGILRSAYFPICVTDAETGNTYVVQTDRRTIVAKTKEGRVIWRANPFEDANLKPYRVEHPIIGFFGKSNVRREDARVLSVGFSSSQFGLINLADGSFSYIGQD